MVRLLETSRKYVEYTVYPLNMVTSHVDPCPLWQCSLSPSSPFVLLKKLPDVYEGLNLPHDEAI